MFVDQLDRALDFLDYKADPRPCQTVAENLAHEIQSQSRQLERLKNTLAKRVQTVVAETALKVISQFPNCSILIESSSLTVDDVKYDYDPFKGGWKVNGQLQPGELKVAYSFGSKGSIFLEGKRVRLSQLVEYKNSIYH